MAGIAMIGRDLGRILPLPQAGMRGMDSDHEGASLQGLALSLPLVHEGRGVQTAGLSQVGT